MVVVGMRDASKSIVMKTYDLLENLFHRVQNLSFYVGSKRQQNVMVLFL